jgi:hypothetical protein
LTATVLNKTMEDPVGDFFSRVKTALDYFYRSQKIEVKIRKKIIDAKTLKWFQDNRARTVYQSMQDFRQSIEIEKFS